MPVVTIHEPGDVVYVVSDGGRVRRYEVGSAGELTEIDPQPPKPPKPPANPLKLPVGDCSRFSLAPCPGVGHQWSYRDGVGGLHRWCTGKGN